MTSRVTYRKHAGSDEYSWAVFVDGQPKWTGMTRAEATHRAIKGRIALEGERTDPRSLDDG